MVLNWPVGRRTTQLHKPPPPPPPPPARPQWSIYVSCHRPWTPFSALCRQNRPCWRRERSLSWKFQHGICHWKSTHSWKTLTLPKHLDRMGYRLQSSRTVPPSSPGRLRHSSIPWSKLGTFLNSSRRPSKLPYSRVGISMLLQTTGRYPCCLSYAKSWKKLSPLSWRAIRKSTAFFLLNSLLIVTDTLLEMHWSTLLTSFSMREMLVRLLVSFSQT